MAHQNVLFPEQCLFEEPRLLFVPAVASALSLLYLLARIAFLWSSRIRRFLENLIGRDYTNSDPGSRIVSQGLAIWIWKLLRLACCTILVGLTGYTVFKPYVGDETTDQGLGLAWYEALGEAEGLAKLGQRAGVALFLFYVYTTSLAVLALPFNFRLRDTANFHLVTLLLIAFVVFAWRNIAPLTIFPLRPVDDGGGWLDWTQFGLLAFAAVVVPLCIPRAYIPLDPTSPETPNPEQTTPLISLVTFTFLDSVVWNAYRSGQFVYDQLPPLADYDHATYLKQRSFKFLDPLRKREEQHLFWGLMKVFWKEYTVMAIVLSIKALMEFAGPVSIRFLLEYLENAPASTPTRPWVWIMWLFLGPVIGSIALQWYNFLSSTLSIRAQGMLTQLLFEHSLRIRLVSDARPSDSASKTQTDNEDATTETTVTLPDGPSTGHTLVANTNTETTQVPHVQLDAPNAEYLTGKINNLMSEDLMHITDGRDFLYIILFTPIQLIVSAVFLYQTLGWSALIGMAFQILSLPIPGKVAELTNKYQVEKMQSSDARVQAVTETLSVIRMIKLLAWERKVKEDIQEKREVELRWYRKRQFLELIGMNVNYATPLIVMAITFATHTLVFKKSLTGKYDLSHKTAIFNVLRQWLQMQLYEIIAAIQAKVSLDRITQFLYKTDLLDKYSILKESHVDTDSHPTGPLAIGFRNASFAWSPYLTNVQCDFRLQIENELMFCRGKINMITGPTGCGKTSMLLALLGEMHFIQTRPDSWFGLAKEDGVAYAAQAPWILNATIRDNVLFGAEYDEVRYKTVIEQCALERDLRIFKAGDQTEVGEGGVTLSGGQKARVSLARAIYSTAKTVLLDDILSALDVHTCRWIVDRCFHGDLIMDRTILIVTHHVSMVGEVASLVVSLGPNGRVVSRGSVQDALRLDPKLRQEAEAEKEIEEKAEEIFNEEDGSSEDTKKPDGRLVVEEEVAQGHVGWAALCMFWSSLGGVGFWFVYGSGSILWDLAIVLQTYWLSIWARAYDQHPDRPEVVDVPYYLIVYAATCAGGLLIYSLTYSIYVLGAVRSSRVVHARLVASVLASPLRWLDYTPMGRIIARFTQDMSMLDGPIPSMFRYWSDLTIQLCSRLIAIVIVSPIFALPAAFITSLAVWIGRVYIAAQLPLKREMSNTRAPLFTHFGATLAGLVSIRAYDAEGRFRDEASRRIDRYTRSARVFNNLNRWVAIRMDTLGGTFLAGLASYLVYAHSSADASLTGFSLTVAVTFSSLILMWVRMLNGFELLGNSLERIQHYVQIDQEPASAKNKVPPAYWPTSGKLVVENLTARYSRDGPAVLHNISFQVSSGERIGVIGRTGSGKSSLALSLLRMIPTEGNVFYDGISTDSINLNALRSNITIIPQQPELMSGTVRQNLDPFSENDDATLNMALRSAGLGATQTEGAARYIGLDTLVAAGGHNISVGQRQILALARAIVRRSQVLILDEATAAIDHTTDSAIQTSIRTELTGLTLIIIAHRLQTVCDVDKILVLDEGKIAEFDTPAALLSKPHGIFKALVDESHDRDALYATVQSR
ncbi:hypothetical protein FRC07_001505 [Ceratobasidium sp. 392]|nr:hypothetical protein FRC07_001505 [Ceratobasidium sp. 392]